MIRRVFIVIVVVLTTGLTRATETGESRTQATTQPEYVGAIVCKNCHEPAFKIWSVSKHSRTFVQLGTGYVEMIDSEARGFVPEGFGGSIVAEARRLGIDADCLRCHTTANGLDQNRKAETFHPEDGVQCEACHGPGGAHVDWMEVQGENRNASRPEHSLMEAFTLKDCATRCHRNKPTHEAVMIIRFDAERLWPRIAHGQADE